MEPECSADNVGFRGSSVWPSQRRTIQLSRILTQRIGLLLVSRRFVVVRWAKKEFTDGFELVLSGSMAAGGSGNASFKAIREILKDFVCDEIKDLRATTFQVRHRQARAIAVQWTGLGACLEENRSRARRSSGCFRGA